jgi:hypothetical protein
MTVKRHVIKSCCGRKNFFFETDKPIRKFQLPILEAAGYLSPKNFVIAGIFYVRGNDVVATSAYGTTRINVHCYGRDCESKLNDFERVLDQAVNTVKPPGSTG